MGRTVKVTGWEFTEQKLCMMSLQDAPVPSHYIAATEPCNAVIIALFTDEETNSGRGAACVLTLTVMHVCDDSNDPGPHGPFQGPVPNFVL